MNSLKIGNKIIGGRYPTFIIAEAGVNHNGKLSYAKQLIDVAVNAGADAVKFQTYRTGQLVTKDADLCLYQKKNTKGASNQYTLLKKFEMSQKMHRILFQYAKERGIIFLSTPFDEDSIDFLDDLGVYAFKISSGDANNIPFLVKIAKKGKPIILSTGMSALQEIKESLSIIRKYNRDIAVLHCTTEYPCPFNDVHLTCMKTIEKECSVLVGYSDHTIGIEIPIAAVALGAKIIEKHITLNKKMAGPDHKASLEPNDLKSMVASIRNVELAFGCSSKKVSSSAIKYSSLIKKSIIAKKNIKKGTVLTEGSLIIKRPGKGLDPKYYYDIIGSITKRDILEEEYICWDDIKIKKKIKK